MFIEPTLLFVDIAKTNLNLDIAKKQLLRLPPQRGQTPCRKAKGVKTLLYFKLYSFIEIFHNNSKRFQFKSLV